MVEKNVLIQFYLKSSSQYLPYQFEIVKGFEGTILKITAFHNKNIVIAGDINYCIGDKIKAGSDFGAKISCSLELITLWLSPI
ncbi:MAG: hypothetical protein GY845_23800 [Planctomycetes bacterium]|nr:hypothetical protein [Planctomycetota bacterium]